MARTRLDYRVLSWGRNVPRSWKTRRGGFFCFFFQHLRMHPDRGRHVGETCHISTLMGADPRPPETQKGCHPFSSAAQPA